jgi:hypothetical protein
VPVEARAARLASMRRPGEALVRYVIEEVIAASEPDVAELLRLTSALPGFTASVCADGGLATDEARAAAAWPGRDCCGAGRARSGRFFEVPPAHCRGGPELPAAARPGPRPAAS